MELQVFASTTDYDVGAGKTLWRFGNPLKVGNYSLNLTEIGYDRRVSSPGELSLHFDVSASDKQLSKSLHDSLIKTECTVSLYRPVSNGKFCMADNYYVAGIGLSASASSQYRGVLKCYSYDHHLTEQKYCEAFTGKTFGTDVFSARLKDRKMKAQTGKTQQNPFPYDFDINRLLFLAFDKGKKYRTDVRDVEVIQPYLVQYNESLYEFLNRVAHRCGEFLYFEDGRLQLGLPEGTRKVLKGETSTLKTFTNNYPLCSYADIGGDSGSGPLFAADYSKKSKDRNNTAPSGAMFDMEYTSDEYLKIISAGDDSKKNTIGWWILFKALCTVFTGDDQVQSMASAASALVLDLIYSGAILPAELKRSYKKLHIEASDRPKASEMAPVNRGDVIYNICNHFYQLIERLENNAERDKVVMCFSSNFQQLRLGQAVDIEDGRFTAYVITRLYGSFTYQGTSMSENHSGEGVPVYGDGKTTVLDELNRVVVPPRGKTAHKVETSSMEAEVCANNDPLRMGRVRVRFPWQDGAHKDASPWIRVTVPFAGTASGSSGFTMTPDVGEHVMLNFVDGNIERPFVDGSLYHISDLPGLGVFENTPFNAGTDFKTRSIVSGNGHNITFKDKPDTNLLSTTLPFVQPVMQIMSKIPGVQKVPEFFNSNSLTGVKGGGVTISDGSFQCSLSIDAGKRAINISSDMGTVAISAFTGITVNAPNGDITIKGKNVSIEAGNNLSLKSGTNIRDNANYAERAEAGIFSSLTSFTTSVIFNHLGVNFQGAFDCSYLRHLWEIFLRPVEGTLSISSKRNVTVTAGKGKVMVPSSLLSKSEVPGKGGPYVSYQKLKFDCFFMNVVRQKVNELKEFIDGLYDQVDNLDGQLKKMNRSFAALAFSDNTNKDFDSSLRSVAEKAADIKAIVPDGQEEVQTVQLWYKEYCREYTKFMEDYKQFVNFDKMDRIFDSEDGQNKITSDDVKDLKKLVKELYFEPEPKDRSKYGNNTALIQESNVAENSLRKVQRKMVMFYLLRNRFVRIYGHSGKKSIAEDKRGKAFGNSAYNTGDMLKAHIKFKDVDDNWTEFLNAVHLEKEEEKKKSPALVGALAGALGFGSYDMDTKQISFKSDKLWNINGAAGPRAWNEISGSGSILMSNMPDTTVKIGPDGQAWAFDRNLDETLLSEFLIKLGLD